MQKRALHRAGRASSGAESGVQLWRWRFVKPGPSLALALLVGEALKGVVTRLSVDRGEGLLPESLYRDPASEHRHAFWLPGDEDGDGLIDHAWVYAANGLPHNVIAALAQVEFVRIGETRYELAPDGKSPVAAGGPLGPASTWRAATPYVTPKWRLTKTGKERPAFTPDAQLGAEIAARGLPKPVSFTWQRSTWLGEDFVMASSFVLARRKEGPGSRPPSDTVASFPAVTFPEPVVGPLAFGFGAHFGLGMLMPLS